MLLRSITAHVKSQNWFAVVLDFVIVVVGVYIGIQVSNWNEARIDEQRGEYFAARLLVDMQIEISNFDQETIYYTTVYDYAKRAVALADTNDTADDNEFVVSTYNATQFNYSEPAQATYDELVATGNLYLLEDENLRNAATFLYNSRVRSRLSNYVIESAFRERVRRIMPHDVQQAVREQCGDIIDSTTGYSSGIPANCRLEFDQERIAEAASILRRDPELRADLAYFLSSIGYFISDSTATKRQALQRLEGIYPTAAPLDSDSG